MNQIRVIAWKEFTDRFRSGWLVACVTVWLIVIGLTSLFGLVQIGRIGFQGYERTVMSLLSIIQYLVPLLGLLIGHDLVVSEREERTLHLILATGVRRSTLLLGKFFGGALTLAVPLLLGFAMAGAVIGFAAKEEKATAFCVLAGSGLALGLVFVALGLLISTWCRSRVQALVFVILTWGAAVFAFDVVALGVLVTTRAAQAAHEIEIVCDPMHVNRESDIHTAFDGTAPAPRAEAAGTRHFYAALLNPVDVFRVINLPSAARNPWALLGASLLAWLSAPLGASFWRFRRLDL